ncbi:hypothetical protein NAEGRDRAFT_78704 [Naegleria gruberi]|uniref:MSP domain-containing protein n=1 Tax=Naegleria gruberi TaxID=5762 RepID=D2V5V5_NAEGR|nr:uncharacterized protein NAEGRDRAFT_78704 [Naegleria gruberi]EFC47717.1 hypothetical protein NAEGRDRAFT_78704 [Naegleria gruberi]|eukprot:XP_002680461.1 hypothetical protein NAEGRDRAFT_78704 [Naegleria gruberi strain NEG-M]
MKTSVPNSVRSISSGLGSSVVSNGINQAAVYSNGSVASSISNNHNQEGIAIGGCGGFQAFPNQIIFKDFEAPGNYKETISFRNNDNVSRRISIFAPKSRFFKVEPVKKNTSNTLVAPGLDVTFNVFFSPDEKIDYSCDLIVRTEQDEFTVPIIAIGLRALLDLPESVTFDDAPVKHTSSKVIYVRNIGKSRSKGFSLEADLPFDVSPREVPELNVGEGVQISISFNPEKTQQYTGKLKLGFDTINYKTVLLQGVGKSANVKLDTNVMALPNTYITCKTQRTMRIINNSNIRVNFNWKLFALVEDEFSYKTKSIAQLGTQYDETTREYRLKKREIENDDMSFRDEAFSIYPIKGEIWPNQELEISVDFHPTKEIDFEKIAFCEVTGRETRLPLKLQGRGRGPNVSFSYTEINIGEIFINSVHEYEVRLDNKGQIGASFDLIKPSSLFGPKFQFVPQSGYVAATESQIIKIFFNSDIIGSFEEDIYFRIEGRHEDLRLHFSGQIIGPTFNFDCNEINFGTVPYGFLNTKYIQIINTCEIPMKYTLRIPEDGTMLKRQFDIIPSDGHILPHTKKQIKIEYLSSKLKDYKANLVVDVEGVGDNLIYLPILATTVSPMITLPKPHIDFGECFIGYEYKNFLDLVNNTALSSKYEIILPSEEIQKQYECSTESCFGIVNNKSTSQVEFLFKSKVIGEISFPLYVKVVGSEQPPFEVIVSAKSIGPVVQLSESVIDFGKVNVLETITKTIQLINKSPIVATYSGVFKGKIAGIFSAKTLSGKIEPNASIDFEIEANLDDVTKFSDELVFSIEYADKLPVKLSASGKGNTIIATESMDVIDFGDQFTATVFKKIITLENKSRKVQKLSWMAERKKGDTTPQVFKITPEKVMIQAKTAQVFTVEGFCESEGEVSEPWQCKIAGGKKDVIIFSPVLKSMVSVPLLKFSDTSLSFIYSYVKGVPPLVQSKSLEVTNISPLPVSFSAKLQPPFMLAVSDHTIGPNQSKTLDVQFNPVYKSDKQTADIKSKMILTYTDHPNKSSVDLIGSVLFPNLVLSSSLIDFGTVVADAEKTHTITMENKGKVTAVFSFIFEIAENGDLSTSQLFDILPMNGIIEPGESVDVKFIYNAAKFGAHTATAICEVEGGPEYIVNLKGESSSVKFNVDNSDLDFGVVPFHSQQEKEIVISNTGKIAIDFDFDFSIMKRKEIVQVLPSNGRIKPGDKQKVTIKLNPKIPEVINEQFTLMVAMYEPIIISVKALSVHPMLTISMKTKTEEEPGSPIYTNQQDFEKHLGAAKKHASRGTTLMQEAMRRLGSEGKSTSFKNLSLVQSVQKEAERLMLCDYLMVNPMKSVKVKNSLARVSRSTNQVKQFEQPDIVLQRMIVDFGATIKGLTKKKSFKLSNVGILPISIQVNKKDLAKYGITMEPSEISNLPGFPDNQSVNVEMSFQSKSEKVEIGEYNAVIPVRVTNGYLIEIEARASVILPEITVSESTLNFGDVNVGYAKVYTIQIFNEKDVNSEWSIEATKKKDNPFTFDIMGGILSPREKKNIQVTFIPTGDKKNSQIFLLKCNYNPQPTKITCNGNGKDLNIKVDYVEQEMGPILPYESTIIPFTISNSSECAVDLYSVEFDEQLRRESEIILTCDSFEKGYILAKPREFGGPLNEDILEKYNEITKPPNPEGDDKQENQDVGIGQIDETPKKRHIFVFHTPPMPLRTDLASFISTSLNIPIITIDETLKDYKSAHLDESLSTVSISDLIGLAISERTGQIDCKRGFIIDGLYNAICNDLEMISKIIVDKLQTESINFVNIDGVEAEIRLSGITDLVEKARSAMDESRYPKLSEEDYESLAEEAKRMFELQIKTFRENKIQYDKLYSELTKVERELEGSSTKLISEIIQERKKEDEEYQKKLEEEAKKAGKTKKTTTGKIPSKSRPTTPSSSEVIPPYISFIEELAIHENESQYDIFMKLYKRYFFEIISVFKKLHLEESPVVTNDKNKNKVVQPTKKKDDMENVIITQKYIPEKKSENMDMIMKKIPGIEEYFTQETVIQTPTELSIPEPFILQVIKKPTPLQSIDLSTPFTILSGKDSDATRWTVQPGGKQELFIKFSSKQIGKFETNLSFGIFGRNSQFTIKTSGMCQYPEISTFHKNVFSRRVKTRPDKGLAKKYIINENAYEYGPLLIRPSYDISDESNLKEYLDVFRFTNNGKFTSEVNITLEKEDKTFNIVPHQLSIPPDQTSEVKIWALPKTVGKIKNSVICTIKNNPIPYKFDISCTGSKPKIELDKTKIDFGKVLLSSTGYNETINIKNMAYIPVVWKIKNKAHIKQEFTIEPSEGKLMPGENSAITVKFNSAVACELEEKMILTVSDAQEILTPEENIIVLKADAFGLDVNMDCVLDFGTVKVYESSPKSISMTNNGKYDAAFKFVIPDKLKSFFTITPMEGVLQTKAKQKTTVEVVFKTNTEVFYNKNKSIQCQLVDNTTKMALGTTNLEVSVKSMFSKFTITPENGINFGPLSFDKERQRPFEIFNTGIFDIQYTLFDYSKGLPESTEDKSNTNDPKKKGNDTKKNNKTAKKVDPQLQIGQFMIQPTVGTIAPGSKASINITFKGDGTKVFQETLGIDISDRNMEEQPNGIAYYIQGESCVPGIVTNEFESIFEEQQIVSNMDMILNPLHSSFTLDERIFHFGTIPVGKKVTEKIKVINPFKVPCNVECSVKPRDMTGNKDINMFEASPPKLFIPPHEHRYVNISFLPPTMNNYSAIFEATVIDGNDPKTKDLKIEIRGEGSLPQVLIKKPEKVGENSILKFPKTAVGRREELPVLISNEGLLPATVRFDFPNHSSLLFPSRLEEFVLESKESKKFSMIFEPHQAEQIETTLNMVVLDNHFEDTSIKVIAESFEEDVIINNLPLGKENELNFGDCYVKAKNERTFVLENHAKVPVRFQFETPDGITVSPCVGHIQPKSSKEIIATFLCDEPTEIKGDLLKCSLKKIEFLNDEEEIDWDDRHKSIKWVEVDEEEEARKLKELEEKKQREKEQKENEKKGIKKKEEKKPAATKTTKAEEKSEPQEAKPKKLVTKRMEVTDPEPQHNIIGDISEKSVAVYTNADYAKFEINTTDVVFSTTKMFETRIHNVTLKNIGKVLLNFSWSSSQYIDGPFELETKQGQIKPGEQTIFTIKYAPQDVDKHEEIFTCYIDNIEPSCSIPSVRVSGISKCPLVHFELPPSDYLSGGRRKASMFQNQEIESLIDKDKTRVIELYSCGIKVKNTKRFYILNPTDVDFKYSWQKIQSDPNAEDNSFSCLTRTGIINSGKKSEIIFEYVPYTIETKESLWMFSIPSRNLNIPFLVVGHAKEPEVFLDTARVNFQTVLVGAKSSQSIHLINREPIPFSFSFDQTEFFEDNQTDRQPVLLLSPKSGTIPADSTIPITLLYTPTAESSFNFQVACRVKKKPSLLTCNVKGEGFLVHESLEVSDESMTRVVPVSFKENSNVDFERAQINEKKIKKVIITNHGNYNFDYQWFHAKNKLITINPDRGTVFKGGKQICDIIFNPTAQVKLAGYKCICKVTNSNSYVLNLFGSGAQPKINFSFLQYDFGAHFLYHQGMDKSPSTMLKIENCDEKDISFEMLYDNKPHLEVEASATVLKPGESRQIKVYFRPREIKLYKETVMFEINGLYKTSVIFTGEGTASKVELSNPVDKVINLGSIRGGEVITKYVNIVNKSKITANVSLLKETLDQLAKCYITLSPKTAFSIHPRQEAQIGLTFKPESRLSTFNVELNAYIDGRIKLLSNVTGSCQGVEVKLNTSTIAFGPVVQNTVVVSRAIIENTGDIGVNYKWNTKGLYSAFSIKPLQGFIPPNEEALLEITYSPTKIDTTGQSSTIECKLDSLRDPIPMTISGICVEKPKGKETLSFRVAVRQKQNKSVKIDNPTKSDWRLKPVIDNPFWSGLEYLEVPANSTREYEVTYAPLSMTLNSPHKGTLFFPLPDGKAILYELSGESLDPLPAGSIIKDLYAKEHHIETLFVENWLGKAQRFAVILDDLNIKSPNQLTAVNYIDVPPISKREYKFSFLPFKDGQFEGKVRFVNEETKEFIYYNVKFNVLKARSSEEIVMETPVRQKIVKTVTVENPLEKESVLAVKCDSTDIIVSSELRIPAKSFAKCEFVYLPLLVSDPKKAKLTIGNDELGIFPFDLLLKPIAKVSERSTHFSVSLGSSQTQTIRFVNFARQATEYTCKIEDNQTDFALVDKPVVKAPQATSLEGNEISLDVTYEPTMTGATKAKLILTSPIGGEYVFWLFGKCSPPRAQGPIEIIPNGTSQITFKNVFDKKTDFKFVIDDPSNSFSVKPDNASMTVKQKLPLTISYKPSSAASSKVTYGKLTISSKGSQLTWLYYLMGKPNN